MAITLEEAKLIAKEFAKAMGTGGGGPSPTTRRAGGGTPLTDVQIEQLQAAYDNIERSTRATVELTEQQREIEQNRLKIKQEQSKLEKAIREGKTGDAAVAENEIIMLINSNQELQKKIELIRSASSASEELANSFGSIFSGDAPDLKKVLDPKNIQGLAKNFSKVKDAQMLSQMASRASVVALAQYAMGIVDLVLKLDEAEVGFMKATGANRDFARSITNSFQETRKFGGTAKEVSAAAQELFTTFTDFTMVSEDVREDLMETSTVLAKMGVSNQDFAKSIQTSTKALGMSADQAAQNMLNLEKFAENLGVAPQKLAADFANAGDMVAKLGQNGTKAFKDLQVVMKVTGMSMDSILGITNKFDTFEGAAEMAGKLNAAIGGNFVNAMDLMMATNPAERFEMIRDSLLDSGLAFDEMSYYQKQFYTDSLGLKDVSELALMMSGNIDLMDGAIQQSQQSMVDAAQRARDLETIQQKLETAFAQLIPIITPLIDAFSQMAGFVADNISVIKPLLGLLIAVASVLLTVGSGGTLGAGGIAGLTLGFGLMFDSVETGGESLTMLGAIFEGLLFPFQAIYEVGKLLYGMFMDMIGPIEEQKELMKTLATIGKALGVVLGVVLVAAIGSIIGPVTAVVAGIGAAIAMIYSFASALFETPFNPPSFLIGLMEIGEGFIGIAKSAMEILNPFSAVERAIRAIGVTFSSILGGVTSFFAALADPAPAENIARIAKAISEVKPVPAAAFTAAMTTLPAAAAGGVAAAAIEGAAEMVSNFVFGSDKSDKKQEITVNLMLDRQKLATVVREINAKSATDAIAERT